MATRELFGEYWELGSESKARGRLVLGDDGFQLELETVLRASEAAGFETGLMHGWSGTQALTLIDGREVARSPVGSTPFPQRLTFGQVVLGEHLASTHEPAFVHAEVTLTDLGDFVGWSGLSLETPPLDKPRGRHRVEWEEVPEPAAEIGDGLSLTFRSAPDFAYASDYEFQLHHVPWVEIASDSPLGVADLERHLAGLLSLVSLGLDRATSVESLLVRQHAPESPHLAAWTEEILTRRRPVFPSRRPRVPITNAFLSLKDLGEDAPGAVAGFFRFREDHPEAAELLFEYQILEGALTPADRFLYLVRFLEAFHRSRFTRQDYLAVRLRQLLAGPAAPAATFFKARPEELATAVKNTRHYYTHYDPSLRDRAVHGVRLDDLADGLLCLVRSCILSEMGVGAAKIEGALRRDPLVGRLESLEIGGE
jgi:hypothetical protein